MLRELARFETSEDRALRDRIEPIVFELPITDVLTLRLLARVLPDLAALWWSQGNFIVGRCARLRNAAEHCEMKMRAFRRAWVKPVHQNMMDWATPQDRCAVCGRYPHEHYLQQNPAAWELYDDDYGNRGRLVIRKNPELRTGGNRLTKIQEYKP